MSISFDSSDAYITRTANTPTKSAYTIAGWWNFDTLPGTTSGIYLLSRSGTTEYGGLRWNSGTSKIRIHDAAGATDITAVPSTGTWVYLFLRTNGTTTEAGWKTIAESDFLTSGHKASQTAYVGGTFVDNVRVGANPFYTTSIDGRVFRLSMWDVYVSDADLLTAAATDLGYTTSINTHIPGTGTGDPGRYADTSGNSRNWTPGGTTISDGDNPSLSSDVTVAASGSAATGGHGIQVPNFSIPL
jgi:hypothetical protein